MNGKQSLLSFTYSRRSMSFSGPPAPKDCSLSDAVDPKSEGTHAEIAVVGLAHLFHRLEALGHVGLQLIVHLLLIPHETLYVLQSKDSSRITYKAALTLLILWRSKHENLANNTWTHSK